MTEPLVGIIMGSKSDWETMRHAAERSTQLGVPHETRIVSAHRTPKRLYEYAHSAKGRGLKLVIAGAGGAAHLPGMTASMTALPVLGVPIESQALKGMDSLLSIVQMPAGVPVGTLAIGKAGRYQRGLARRGDAGEQRRGARRSGSKHGARRKPDRWPKRPNDDRAGLDHRHHRRRPARPHAGDGGGPARLHMPYLRPARAAAGGRRRGSCHRARRSRTCDALRAFARAMSTSRPMNSKICRSSRFECSAPSCRPGTRSLAVAQDRAEREGIYRAMRRPGDAVARSRLA